MRGNTLTLQTEKDKHIAELQSPGHFVDCSMKFYYFHFLVLCQRLCALQTSELDSHPQRIMTVLTFE